MRPRHTKPPSLVVVGGPVGNPFRMLLRDEEMALQLFKRQDRVDRRAILKNVQIVGAEVDNTSAVHSRDISIFNVPLARHRPIEHGRARGHLAHRERDIPADNAQSLAQAATRDTAADRKQLRRKAHHLCAGLRCLAVARCHRTSSENGEAVGRTAGNASHRTCNLSHGVWPRPSPQSRTPLRWPFQPDLAWSTSRGQI